MSRMNGWVKLHRQSLDHWLYNESRPHTRREAWEDILLLANHEDTKVMIQGELIECKTGQSVMSLKNWAKQFKWTIQQVRTFFSLLQKDNMITTEGLRKTTRITVCNYVNYQKDQHTDNTQITHKQHTDNNEITTNKKDKKEKKVYTDEIFLNELGWSNNTELFNKLKSLYPKLFLLKYPLRYDEHFNLIKIWTSEKVRNIYSEMQNYAKLETKSESANLTASNWLTRNKKREDANVR